MNTPKEQMQETTEKLKWAKGISKDLYKQKQAITERQPKNDFLAMIGSLGFVTCGWCAVKNIVHPTKDGYGAWVSIAVSVLTTGWLLHIGVVKPYRQMYKDKREIKNINNRIPKLRKLIHAYKKELKSHRKMMWQYKQNEKA